MTSYRSTAMIITIRFAMKDLRKRNSEASFDRYVAWIEQFIQSGNSLDIGCSTGFLPKMLQEKGFHAEG